MITGRGPGAPGVTPGLEFTRRRAAAGGTGGQAVDLGEIRRSEEAINVLAARGAAGAQLAHDPALALLGALAADVDTPSTRPEPGEPGVGVPGGGVHDGEAHGGVAGPAWPGRAAAQRAAARQALAGPQTRGAAAWLRAAVRGRRGGRPGQRDQPDRHEHAGPAGPRPGAGRPLGTASRPVTPRALTILAAGPL